ncbi:Na/Pi cotransporter family protein [Aureimonas jatrophae]|uniref:Phosphate:Na+ symporter n=1 Tax=Aureimonas jatrophae TaxID=1166073 RepID=A0A1H0LRS7_9HYPH|nr:Na/Pi cotransporter family protein [Aureimonas jatrophae]MBB3952718.1 phosphate:Na+ symporter [Aureimonas jatrophae]SDO70959.1 phosphate:Na+ symporter [Aureimonas jatrophae]
MQSVIVMINLAGAVALLLFGLAEVKQGVLQAFGGRLRAVLAAGTRRSWRALLSGLGATLALQSSTATGLMTASFVERGLVEPRMAQVVLLGANIGTALTAWIVAAGIAWLSPVLLLLGFALRRNGAGPRQGAGIALMGVGLLLLSLHLLSLATEPMRASPALAAFIGLLDDAWPVALLLSAGLALAAASSLAVVILVTALAAAGILSDGLVVVLVLGANLGGAIPPVLATSGAPMAARRVVLGNLVVRGCGTLAVLPLADRLGDALTNLGLAGPNLPVDVHLLFNLALALAAWPLAGSLARLMRRLLPDTPQERNAPKFLDPTELSTPVVALASATREVLGVGDLVEKMLCDVRDAFRQRDPTFLRGIEPLEKDVDRLQQAVKIYIAQISHDEGSDKAHERSAEIVDYAINLEHIGDIIEKGLVPEIGKMVAFDLRFSDEGFRELDSFMETTIENLRMAQTIFVTRDLDLSRRLMDAKLTVRQIEKTSAARHFQRLRENRRASIETSSLHLDILRDLKRINAHIASVAHPIMDAEGLLVESRVRHGASGLPSSVVSN